MEIYYFINIINNYIVLFFCIYPFNLFFLSLFKVENLIVQYSMMKFQQKSPHQYLLFILYLQIYVRCTRYNSIP